MVTLSGTVPAFWIADRSARRKAPLVASARANVETSMIGGRSCPFSMSQARDAIRTGRVE